MKNAVEKYATACDDFNEAALNASRALQAFAIESGHKMPKARRKAGQMPKNVAKAIEEYKAAYKALYGAAIEVEYKDGYINGVSLKLFRKRINQLRYRKGV